MKIIENKIFIFNNYPLSGTDGGPSGFLAQNIASHKSNYFEMNYSLNPPTKFERLTAKLKLFSGKSTITARKAGLTLDNNFTEWGIIAQNIFQFQKLERYKFIYFHDVWQLKFCLPLIRQDQKIILQCHCPELPSIETASQAKFQQVDIEWCKQAEKDAFARADILIFPNQYVTPLFSSLINSRSKVYYLLSGCRPVSKLRLYPVSEKINLLYIGRRNSVKGFDIVLNAFKEAREARKDINLILIGNGEEEIDDGIFDIGFSNSPHHWIYSCDYLINCNRQSYLDLSLLEALSVGTPIILSTNYGHKQFQEDKSKGILDIGEPTVENLKTTLISENLRKKTKNYEAVEENRNLYERRYSDSIYRSNLENLLCEIIQCH